MADLIRVAPGEVCLSIKVLRFGGPGFP